MSTASATTNAGPARSAEAISAAAPPTAAARPAVSRRGTRRILGTIIAVGCAAILGLAAWLTPDAAGHGTHEQLNLPPCGWILAMDLPCPTCGMTTSFAHAAHGHFLRSFLTQPAGALLALATAMGLFLSSYVAVTGSRVGNVLAGLWTRKVTIALLVVVALSWGYKILSHKGLL